MENPMGADKSKIILRVPSFWGENLRENSENLGMEE